MRKAIKIYFTFIFITSILYGLAIVYIPEIYHFLHLGENKITNKWTIIICGGIWLYQLVTLLMQRFEKITWLINAIISFLVYIVFTYIKINVTIGDIAYALTFILLGFFILNQMVSYLLHRMKKIYDPIIFEKRETIPFVILVVFMIITFIPFNQTATLLDKWFIDVDNVVFEKNEITYFSEDFKQISKKYFGTVYLTNGKHYQIKLSQVNVDDKHNFMRLGTQTIHYTYRNYDGEMTIENQLSDDILFISKKDDLAVYKSEDGLGINYLIDNPNYQGVYFDVNETFEGIITFGVHIQTIYFYREGDGYLSTNLKLITKADTIYIYINNISFNNNVFLESQSKQTHLIAFGNNIIDGGIRVDNDLVIQTYGKLAISSYDQTTIAARNLIIKGDGSTLVFASHGRNGYDGSFAGYDGTSGNAGYSAIRVNETITIDSTKVRISGGNGGNGGNGAKSIPGLFVTGGDGGNGGSGASAIIAKKANINKEVVIVAGLGGTGGKGGQSVGVGWDGKDGKAGRDGEKVEIVK